MAYLSDYTLKKQSPENQFGVLHSVEKGDEITVSLNKKGSISGPVTSVVENGPSDDPEEVHAQFQNFESPYREDDMGHHTVSITRTEDGAWGKAELSYSWTDTGRVRKNTVDTVARIWPSLAELQQRTILSHEEAQIVSLKETGLNRQEMAEKWDCDEMVIDAILASVRKKHDQAEQTVDRLESAPVDLDGKQYPSISPNSGEHHWRDNLDQQADSELK